MLFLFYFVVVAAIEAIVACVQCVVKLLVPNELAVADVNGQRHLFV